MATALRSLGNPSKILEIRDFPSKILPDPWNFLKSPPGSWKSPPRARRPARNLPDCQICSKPTASLDPWNFGFRGLNNPKNYFASDAWFRSRWFRRFLNFLPISIILNRMHILSALIPQAHPIGSMVISTGDTPLLPQRLLGAVLKESMGNQ